VSLEWCPGLYDLQDVPVTGKRPLIGTSSRSWHATTFRLASTIGVSFAGSLMRPIKLIARVTSQPTLGHRVTALVISKRTFHRGDHHNLRLPSRANLIAVISVRSRLSH
jgi:hypothetical protein